MNISLYSHLPIVSQQPFPDALCLLAVTVQVGLMGPGMVCVPQEETNYTLIDSAHGDSISGTSTVETAPNPLSMHIYTYTFT